MNKVAFNPSATYPLKYHDFSTKYNAGETFRRDLSSAAYAAGNFVRFYFLGRRNGSGSSGAIDQTKYGHYWLAEPASNESNTTENNWSYGSVFMLEGSNSNSLVQIYPVAGGQELSQGNAVPSPKWQRTHGCHVRPMRNNP